MQKVKKTKLKVALLLDVLFLLFIIFGKKLTTYMLDDLSDCLYYKVLGVKCLTCGGTRCVNALLSGRISEAFGYNPYVVVALIFVVFYLIVVNSCWIFGKSWARKALDKMYTTAFVLSATGVSLGYMVLRNIFDFIP